jgi:hypothetical protein
MTRHDFQVTPAVPPKFRTGVRSMRTVSRIIDICGGLGRLADNPIRLDGPPGFMRLVVEYLGVGPRGLPLVSVAHYYEQNGDLMADPEMTFEVAGPEWQPLTFRQDGMGVYREAVYQGEDGRTMVRPRLLEDLRQFARIWDDNIATQGFVGAALRGAPDLPPAAE